MKFEELLMQQKRVALEQEVNKLRGELEAEETLTSVLKSALNGSLPSNQHVSSLLPRPVQVLLSELAMVEEEIKQLEGKVEELRLDLYQETRVSTKIGHRRSMALHEPFSRSHNYDREAVDSRASLSSVSDIRSLSSKTAFNSGMSRIVRNVERVKVKVKANEVSEELVKCLIGIFLELNQTLDKQGVTHSIANTQSINFFDSVRDIGPYNNFIQLTSSSLDVTRFPECSTAVRKLRVLTHKLSNMDLAFLTYKQKLAFWINIYNACIMHAFLEHGLPSTQEKLLALMNKAAFNVGGIVLNALAIEHFILRYPSQSKHAPAYEKEMLLRNAYGLGYPEPNVTFALCRGTRSSPALRVYTADGIVNEMERAKVEYLEASVGVTSRKKIIVPKLLQWHMNDFADDIESLLEWIYSQLPRSGSLKRLIMECLNAETKSPLSKMVELSPYDSHFRYLLPQSLN